ncbi:DUF6093 family protein [Nonomuraea sp. NPDC050663]|uniref:DUF6093 family protein n=1 Tax=Nonomuraea sp. NPDC050663 TaxID=3364370 RepID=UPI0037AA27C0
MSVEDVLAAGRAAALTLMRDTCKVERKSGAPVLDPDTGLYVQAWATIHAELICRVKPRTSSETEWGEHEVTLHQYAVGLPWDTTPAIGREDRLTVLTSDDAWLVGRPLEVVAISLAGTSTTRRILVEDKEG